MPELHVNIDAIGRNTEAVAALLRGHGLDLVAVTKGCQGDPRVAAAMLTGGAVALADTRDAHLRRLRAALPGVELHRIDLPSVARAFVPGDVTYVSSVEGVRALAAAQGQPHGAMIAVDTGDEREGVPQSRLYGLASAVAGEPRLRLVGVATNFACFKGRPERIRESVQAVARAALRLKEGGFALERVAGGNSSVLWLIARGERLPEAVTELRCGEALLLGRDSLYYKPLPGCRRDACTIRAEVVEEYTRMAAEGSARRLVLAIGRQDLGGGTVKFAEPGLREIGRTSDHLVVEVAAGRHTIPVGTMIGMIPRYEALAAAWMSPYVRLKLRDR